MRVLLLGFGNVGRTVASLLTVERPRFPGLNSLDVQVTGLVTRTKGALANPRGINLTRAVTEIRSTGSFDRANPEFLRVTATEALANLEYDVLVELTPLSIEGKGEPATTYVKTALSRGRSVVTANKGPAAFAFRELRDCAAKNRARFLYESTVMDGAPVFSLAESSLKGCVVKGFSGILNSTTTYILTRMEDGADLEGALEQARREGFVEADAAHDLDGWDAAAKVSVLANALMNASLTPPDIVRQGISGLTPAKVKKIRAEGKILRLVGRGWREGSRVRGRVELATLPLNHPFAGVQGSGSILRIETDLMCPILITQERPTLYDTAYGVLNDLLLLSSHPTEGRPG